MTINEEGGLGEVDTHRTREKRKQRVTYLMNLYKWMVKQGEAEVKKKKKKIHSIRDSKLWRSMISHILKGHNTQNDIFKGNTRIVS